MRVRVRARVRVRLKVRGRGSTCFECVRVRVGMCFDKNELDPGTEFG